MTARLWACAAALGLLAAGACRGGDVRVGCFFGGRSYVLFRAYLHGYFEREGVPAAFYSRYLDEPGFVPVPRSQPLMQLMRSGPGPRRNFGKVSGDALVSALEAGDFDAVTVGESSFIAAVSRGAPLVAVAALARSARGRPSEAIVLRKGVVVRSPSDFRGKRLASRRSGPGGEAVFLRRFVASIGLDPRRDVTLIENVDEDSLRRDFRDGSIDGALCRVEMTAQLVRDGFGVVYRPMDWVDPGLSQGLIVFRRDFVARHPDRVARFVRAYARSVRDEAMIPQSARAAETRKGLRTVLRFDGLDLPRADDPPRVRLDLLKRMQALLVQDRVVANAVDLTPYVDSRFLEKADVAAR